MAVRLIRATRGPRSIPLAYGVSFTFKPFGFAEYRETRAWAEREAQEALSGPQKAALAGAELDELGPSFEDKLIGLAAQMHLDRLVTNFCTGWDGVMVGDSDEAAEPLPFTPDNWEWFREELPLLAEMLDRKIQSPMHAVILEGNGSAPLPNIDTQAV